MEATSYRPILEQGSKVNPSAAPPETHHPPLAQTQNDGLYRPPDGIPATANPTTTTTTTTTARNPPASFQRQWAVALFSVSTVLLFADQNLMSPNLTAMARDFGFDDQQRDQKLGGDIALAFFVLGAPASLVVGCLADTYNRARLLALCVALGEGACLATYAVRTYRQLYVCRAVTGVALGGALPLIYSVLGDLYAAEDRHMVNAIVGIGTGVGISVGQGVAGFLGPTWGWRLPFVVISVPALVCAALVLFTVQDPPRGRMEAAVLASSSSSHGTPRPSPVSLSSLPVEMIPLQIDEERATRRPSLCRDKAEDDEEEEDAPEILSSSTMTHPGLLSYWKTFTSLVSTPTVIFTLLQGAPGCVPWGIINSFLNDFLSENRGMSVEAATTVILVFGVGNFFGLLLGGSGGTYLYRRDERYPALLAGGMAIASCVPFWFLLNKVHAETPPLVIGLVALTTGVLSGGTGPIVKATLQNVTLPQARGQAFALFNTFDDFGRGLGPVFIARLIGSLGGRTPAFNVGVLGWLLCGVMNLAMFFTVSADEASVQRRLTANLSANSQ